MISSLAPASFDNKEIGIPSSNRNFTQRSLNSNPYRFPYRLSFPLFFFLTSSTSSMGSLLSPSEECHPFTLSYLAHDLVVSPGMKGKGRHYRRTLRYLRLSCSRDDEAERAPAYLAKCFRHGITVLVFQGRGHGAVSVEYRIPVESLKDEYADRARRLISARKGN